MRWFRIRKANIEPSLRHDCERFGETVVRRILVELDSGSKPLLAGKPIENLECRKSLWEWLTEQLDRDERNITWMAAGVVAANLMVVAILISLIR